MDSPTARYLSGHASLEIPRERIKPKAKKEIRDFYSTLINTELVEITKDAVQLADSYIADKVVGKTSRNDCLHIAIATVSHVDVLVSWNFKHIVNIYRIRGYNSVNIRLGYSPLEIRSPKDIVGNEN